MLLPQILFFIDITVYFGRGGGGCDWSWPSALGNVSQPIQMLVSPAACALLVVNQMAYVLLVVTVEVFD